MGLSLRNVAKKIGSVLGHAENAVAHGGAVHAIGHVIHAAPGYVEHNVLDPLAQAPVDASAQLYQHIVAPTLHLPNLNQNQVSFNPGVQSVAKKIGATGSRHQTVASAIQLALALGTGGVGNVLEKGTSAVLPDVAPAVAKSIVPKMVSSGGQVGAFNAAAAAGQGATPGEIAKSGATGAAVGSLFPVAGKVIGKTVKAVPKAAVAIKQAPGKFAAYQDSLDVTPPAEVPQAPAPAKVSVKTPAAPTPAPNIVKTINSSDVPAVSMKTPAARTSIPEVNKRINDMASVYSTPSKFSGQVQDVVKQAKGQSQAAINAAYALRGSLEKHLSSDELQQVSDIMDGYPVKNATAKAQEVATALKPLQDRGFAIRKAINPNVNKVQDYVTRLPSRSIGARVSRSGKFLGKIQNLSDIHNLSSVFSQERQIGKFVDSKGNAVYGNPTKLGLTDKGSGKFVDSTGTNYKQVAVSKRELQNAGVAQYEHNIGRISGIYHGDTASLKIRSEALSVLKKKPETYGLYTVDKAPAGSVPVRRIPELDGLYGTPENVKALEDGFGYRNASGPIGKAYDAVANTVQQFIVVNPFFHGMNQLFQTGIAAGNMPGIKTGWFKVAQNVFDVTESDIRGYLEAGGHIPTYGTHHENWLSDVTRGLTKVNSRAMNGIESRLRVGLYKASIAEGMTPKQAIDNIDRFLGDSKQVDPNIRRATLFFHYFKTMATALGHQVAHPKEQAGSIANAAALAGVLAAVTYGYREFTGNKDAYVRVPGELGLVKEGYKAVGEIRKGELPSIATNRINPLLKEGIQQSTNHDFFTQGNVSDTAPVKIGPVSLSPNVTHAANSLIAPAQVVERGVQGRRNLAETIGNQFGVYEPHAKGYQAAPKGPAAVVLNTKGALKGTGMEAQNAYFDGLKQAKKSLAGDKKASAALTYYLAKSKDPGTGQTIQNSPSESIQNASAMFANDKLRNTVQAFEKKQPSHDPMWDLPADKLKTYMDYKEQFTGDAAKKFILQKNPWIKDTIAASEKFYSSIPKIPGNNGSRASDQTPTYPTFDKATQSLMDTYDAANQDQKDALIKDHAAELSSAWNKVAVWTNQMRKAEGAPELKGYPVADKQTQQVLDYYNTLPKGTGARSAWIKANPAAYKKMTDYLTQASMNTLVKNAALDQFVGSEPNQELLKSIKNVGQYDITKNADGTYSLGSGGSSSSSPYSKYGGSAGPDYKGVHALLKNNRVSIKRNLGRVKKAHISTPSSSKVKSKGPSKPKVSIKASKV